MPQPASICEAVLDTAYFLSEPYYVGNLSEVDLPMSIDEAANKPRFAEVLRDLQSPSSDDRNFVIEIEGRGRMLRYLGDVMGRATSVDRHAREAIFTEHFRAMAMPLMPFKVWTKQLMGKPILQKREGIYSGWLGLLMIPIGVTVVAVENPIVNADRYLRLRMQEDHQFLLDVRKAAKQFMTLDSHPVHFHRDFVISKYSWEKPPDKNEVRLNLNGTSQTIFDTRPMLQRLFLNVASLFSSNQNPELKVMVDFMFNAKKEKMLLVVRTQPQS